MVQGKLIADAGTLGRLSFLCCCSLSQGQDADPHGVQKLLELLRSQQDGKASPIAEKDATVNETSNSHASSSAAIEQPNGPHASSSTTGWQAELQRLKRSGALPTQSSGQDLRHISFAQALPHLTQLSKNDNFLRQLMLLKVGRWAIP